MVAVLFLLGCKDAFHDPEWDPNTATYEQDGITRTITFNANGGSGTAPGRQSAQSGETIYLPGAGGLSRSNYNFGGWDANAAGTGAYYPSGSLFTVPNQDVTLYARWDAASSQRNDPANPGSVTVTGVSLNKSSTSLTVGATETLFAMVAPTNAANQNVTWSSSNISVATVSYGTVSAIAAGSATITVRTADGGRTAICNVTVSTTTVAVTGVSLSKSSTSLNVGATETIFAMVAPTNATNQNVTWSSSNPSAATVSNGVVSAVSAGTTTITVTTVDGGKTATCSVAVNASSVAVTGVSLNKSSTSLTVGATETLTATITPSNATNKSVTWSSSNASVATVSNGTVSAVSAGTATITVTTADGGKTASCSVTVAPVQPAVPSTPTGVTASASSSSSITVSWSSVTGATGYRVYRSASASGTYNSVGEVTTTSFTDTGLLSATTYYYRVSAFNSAGESAQSSPVSATPPSSLQFDGIFSYRDVVGGVEIAGYNGSAKSVTIPSQINGKAVVSIGNYAFQNKQLTNVSIPNSVTTIGVEAFRDNQLTSVSIPNSVTTIWGYAFAYNQLTSLTLPNSVTTIGVNAFSYNQLTNVTFGNNVQNIGPNAFFNNQLTSVIIPNSVTSIEDLAFVNNEITSVTIGANVSLGINFIFHFDTGGNNFNEVYAANSKSAGTYVRSNVSSPWSKL